jgi:hypothetical protein
LTLRWGLTLLLLGARARAQEPTDEVVRKAVVRIDVNCSSADPADKCWGTGIVVQDNPVVIATCYHVIRSRRRIGIHAPAYAQWLNDARVSSVAVYPLADLAFLRVDISEGRPLDRWFSSPVGWSIDDAAQNPVSPLRYSGTSSYDYPNGIPVSGLGFVQVLPLARLGGPRRLEVKGPPGNVFEVDSLVYPGDSGGPVFDAAGKLIGLIAGRVKLRQTDKLRYFAVPSSAPIPTSANEWRPLPVHIESIFTSDLEPYVSSLIAGPALPAEVRAASPSFEPAVRECLVRIDEFMRPYTDRRNALPTESEALGDCQRVYGAVRELLIREESAQFKLGEASAVARTLSIGVDTLEKLESDAEGAALSAKAWGFKRMAEELEASSGLDAFASVLAEAESQTDEKVLEAKLEAERLRRKLVQTLAGFK